MFQNLCGPAAFKMPDMDNLKPMMAAQSKLAGLFAAHATRQITLAGELSQEMFAATAKIAAASAEPGKLESAMKEVPEALTAALSAKAEAMGAATRALTTGLIDAVTEPVKA
jgi:protein involved in temperature-dependent protein secretion